MAIDFITDLKSQDDGMANSIAAKMAKIRVKRREVENMLKEADKVMDSMDKALPDDVPNLEDIESEIGLIKGDVSQTSRDIAEIPEIFGSCLDGAMGGLNSIKKDAYGLIEDGMDALNNIAGMTQDMLDLAGYYNKAKDMLKTLGVDEIIAAVNDSLGCLSDSSLIADVQSELSDVTRSLGLGSDGAIDEDSYGAMMAEKMTNSGFSLGYADSLSTGLNTIAEGAKDIGNDSKAVMKDSITTAKNNIPKVPAPPRFF
jgi:hypothetical protein